MPLRERILAYLSDGCWHDIFSDNVLDALDAHYIRVFRHVVVLCATRVIEADFRDEEKHKLWIRLEKTRGIG